MNKMPKCSQNLRRATVVLNQRLGALVPGGGEVVLGVDLVLRAPTPDLGQKILFIDPVFRPA